ncbi:MAG: L,D-transpeptidase family protein [Hyphomicrobium sp.]|uniref:L,D-transpeptidase n=1 Tax=Hyphomicrobium sp. TaxID=82 RepID=UPI003D10C67A
MPHGTRTPQTTFTFRATLRGAAILLLGVSFATLTPRGTGSAAFAQSYFNPYGGSYYGPYDKVRVKKAKRRQARAAEEAERDAPRGKKGKDKDAEIAERPAEGPLVVSVSLARQRLVVYDANGPIASSPISSGRVGYSTPTGVFSIVQKKRMHFSNLYGSAPMPNMQRITWSGVALHAGALPGYPASHGCIRLPQGFSKKLFGLTKMGTRVIVTREPVTPVAITHDRLFAAYPPEGDLAATAAPTHPTQVADASHAAGGSEIDMTGALVTAAAAAGTETDPARSGYRERRRLEAERLNAEIRTAGYAKAEKMIEMTAAQKAAAVARQPLIGARAEAERLAEHLHHLERALENATAELADLKAPHEEPTGKRKRKSKAMDDSKRIAKIAALEAKVARLPSEIEATRSASEHSAAALTAAEQVAGEAEDRRRAVMSELMALNATLSRALAKEQAAKKLAAMRNLPVSIFISRAKQRLYIRQGYTDVLDVPVTFDRPDEPVGTHVFTALDFAEGKTAMTWSVASVPYDPQRSAKKKKDKEARKKPAEPVVAAVDLASQTAAAALDRIVVPEDVREQIADVMKPGSSVVVSDLGIGNETGEYTDFIVPIR